MNLLEAIRNPWTALPALACYAKFRMAMLGYPVLVDKYSLQPLTLKVPSTLFCCNPSIMALETGWLTTVRAHNWYSLIDGKRYKLLENREKLINECWLFELTDDFLPTKKIRLYLDSDNLSRQDEDLFLRHGIIDCRLFKFQNANYLLGYGTNLENKTDTMLLGQLVGSDVRVKMLTSPKGRTIEKNWMPVASSEEKSITAIYNVNPLSLVQLENGTAIEICNKQEKPQFGEYRGSSQLIPYKGGMLCVVHRVIQIKWRRVYLHRFILFDENWDIKSLSPEFFIEKKGIEFCAGLARKGDRFVISYGVNDVSAHLLELHGSLVAKLLAPAPTRNVDA